MIDVLLTHSYFLRFDRKEFRAMMPYPPLGTLYAAAVLQKAGFTVALHDVMLRENEDEILETIEKNSPRLVIIYDDQFNYLSKMCLSRMREAAFRMTSLAKERGCVVALFSSDATDHIPLYRQHGADFVICGEPENTLAELAAYVCGRSSALPREIQGLAFWDDDHLIRTAPRMLMENPDDLPFPAWDLLDIERYRSAWRKRHGYFSINMVTTRGCPYHCNWCAKPIYGQVYHSRSPENVVGELLELKARVHPDHIWFADDIFGLKPGWIEEFSKLVNASGAKVPFKCLSRVDLLLRDTVVEHLARAGCQTVWVGAESGSQAILDAMEKGTTVGQIQEASSLLHKHGLRVGFFLQFGYPGESAADIGKTLSMIRTCKPDDLGISVSYPLPGTKFYESVRNDLVRKQNWVDSADLDLMFQGTFTPEYYRVLHTLTHKKLRVWQALDSVKGLLGHQVKLDRTLLWRLAKSAYHALMIPGLEARLRTLESKPSRVYQGEAG